MERLTVEIPSESICLNKVACPNGHSLMDPAHPMDGAPSIRLAVLSKDGEGLLHLSAWYGNFDYGTDIVIEDNVVYELLCPDCRVSTRSEDKCMFCGAPMFQLNLPNGGLVQGCSRKGCHNHKLKFVDLNTQLAQLFEVETRPRF